MCSAARAEVKSTCVTKFVKFSVPPESTCTALTTCGNVTSTQSHARSVVLL